MNLPPEDDQEEEIEEVPEGAAYFPEIPDELGVHPLLLAVLHATVFMAGSSPAVVNGPAADEAVEAMAKYLGRLQGPDLARTRQDLACLTAYARKAKWAKELVRFLKNFLSDFGIDDEEGNDE